MKRSALLALVCVYIAMVAAALTSRIIFDRLPHLEDEFAYLFQARIFEQGDVYIPTPQPNRAYWQPFLINLDDKRFSKYPPGWSLLLAMGTATQTPWTVNVWFAGLSVALVYRFGRELYNDAAGICAALLLTISPIAILLSGTLMSHTSTLFFVLLFAYGLWRLERHKNLLWWGSITGISLGIIIASRPLAAVGIAIPLVIYSGLRLLWVLLRTRHEFLATLQPLLAVTLFTLLLGGLFPAYNAIISGDPFINFYTLIWKYDTVGFGEGHGRYAGREVMNLQQNGVKINLRTYAGHSPERGWRNLKRDWACYSRDLFGWTENGDNPPPGIPTQGGNDCVVDKAGLSWLLLPCGFLLMPRRKWTLLLLLMGSSLILIHITYWIGAGVYSARYFFEATGAFALVSGAGVSGLARLVKRIHLQPLVYVGFIVAIGLSVINYTPHRLQVLEGYGRITDDLIQEVQARRENPNKPVLVIAYGEHHWRDIAPLMALTSPYANSDILGLRDTDKNYMKDLVARYPERQVFLLINKQLVTLADFEANPSAYLPAN